MAGFGQLDWDVPSVGEWLRKPQSEQPRGDVVEACLKWLTARGVGPLARTQGRVSVNGRTFCFYGYLRKQGDAPFFNQPARTELPHFYIIQLPDGDTASPQTFCMGTNRYQVVTAPAAILNRLRDNFRIEAACGTTPAAADLSGNTLQATPLSAEEFLARFSEDEQHG